MKTVETPSGYDNLDSMHFAPLDQSSGWSEPHLPKDRRRWWSWVDLMKELLQATATACWHDPTLSGSSTHGAARLAAKQVLQEVWVGG